MLNVSKELFITNSNNISLIIQYGNNHSLNIINICSIIINPKTILGKNINIATGTVIGQENRGKRKGTPIIGNEVWIGANAVIVGNIKIGNDVLIAPLSYVNFDVPDHSIVVGNPAKIISKEFATKDYINNKI